MYDSLTYLAVSWDAVSSCGPVRDDYRVAAFGEEEIEEKKKGEGVAVRDLDEGRDKKPKVLPILSVYDISRICAAPASRSSRNHLLYLIVQHQIAQSPSEVAVSNLACSCKRSQLIADLYT